MEVLIRAGSEVCRGNEGASMTDAVAPCSVVEKSIIVTVWGRGGLVVIPFFDYRRDNGELARPARARGGPRQRARGSRSRLRVVPRWLLANRPQSTGATNGTARQFVRFENFEKWPF